MASRSKAKKITEGIPVQVWFPKQSYEQIKSHALIDQRSVPGTIRFVVEEWLEARHHEQKQEGAA